MKKARHPLSLPSPKPFSRKAIYRFRKAYKRSQVFLAIYTYPNSAPQFLPLATLYKLAGKVRRFDNFERKSNRLSKEIRKRIRKQKQKNLKRLKAYWKSEKDAIQLHLRFWRRCFPYEPAQRAFLEMWSRQVSWWLSDIQALLQAWRKGPYDANRLHELRRHLRAWELASTFADLPAVPPPDLPRLLGKAHDYYQLCAWLEKHFPQQTALAYFRQKQAKAEKQAITLWQAFYASWR